MKKVWLIHTLIFWQLILVFSILPAKDRIIPLLPGGLTRVSSVHATEMTSASITFIVEIPSVNAMESQTGDTNFTKLTIDGFSENDMPGQPALPVLGKFIAVPSNATVAVRILKMEFTELEGMFIPPAKLPQPESARTNVRKLNYDQAVYQSNDYFPQTPAWIESDGTVRGLRLALLRIAPIQFNPVARKARVATRLEVEVSFESASAPEIEPRLRSRHFDAMLQRLVVNWDVVTEAMSRSTENAPHSKEIYGCDYLIITRNEFRPAADSLALWRKMCGWDAKVALVEDLGNTAEAIRRYIQSAYDTWSPVPSFVLFLGDAEFIPTNYVTDHPSEDNGKIGTDLYYTTLDGSDYFPDLIAGRIAVDTGTDAKMFVRKIIGYERNPISDAEFYTHVEAAAYFQDDDDPDTPNLNERDGYEDRRFVLTTEEIRNFLLLQEYSVSRIYFAESEVTPTHYNDGDYASGQPIPSELLRSSGFAWDGNANDISGAINRGCFLVTHRDHGGRDGWGEPRYINGDVKNLSNGDKLPVVFSTNCNTGWFDNETDDDITGTGKTSECFVEFWLRNYKGGAVGVFGSTRVSYSGYNDALAKGFFDAIWPQFLSFQPPDTPAEPIVHLGQVLNYGKLYMANQYSRTETRLVEFEEFHYYGDPASSIWTKLPQQMSVDRPDSLFYNQTELVFQLGEANAVVTLVQQGEILATAISTETGFAALEFVPIHSGEPVTLCVTKPNFRPYIADIKVYAPQGLSIIINKVNFIDQNSDAAINSGEMIYWSLDLNNMGPAITEPISFKLMCSDSLITLLEDFAAVLNLGANEKFTLTSLSFRVSNSCPSKHRVAMWIDVSAGEEFHYSFPLDFTVVQGNPEIAVSPTFIADRVASASDSLQIDLQIKNNGFGALTFTANEEGRMNVDVGDSGTKWWATIPEGAGNVYTFADDINMLRFGCFMNIISPVQLFFVIYEGENMTGQFHKIGELAQSVSEAGEATIWSDVFNIKLSKDKYYCLGVSSTGGDAQVCRALQVPPFDFSLGNVATGTLNFGGAPPADNFNQTFSKLIAFVQKIETGTGTWLNYSSEENTLLPGESTVIPVTLKATHADTTYFCNFIISSNDANNDSIQVPVYFMVGSANVKLICHVLSVDDSQGNNDRKLNMGEHILLPVTVKNIGIGTASHVQAELKLAHPDIALQDSVAIIGDIASNQDITLPAFAFAVSPRCEDGQVIPYTIELSATGDTTAFDYSAEVEQGNPIFDFSPDSINATIETLDDSLSLAVEIRNSGYGRLIYKFGNPIQEELAIGTMAESWWLPLKNGIGNIVYQVEDCHILGMQCYFKADSGAVLYFSIYESDSLYGDYRRIAESQALIRQTGSGWRAPFIMECDLRAEKYYYMGASWIGTAQVARMSEAVPLSFDYGTVLSSSFNLTGAPPSDVITFKMMSSIPIAMKLITGSGLWMTCPTAPDTLYPGDQFTLPIKFYATAPDTTFFTNIVVQTNQERTNTHFIPVSLRITAPASGIPERASILPVTIELEQNYPNPFNPVTEIQYGIHRAGQVEIRIFNVLGQQVRTLVDTYQRPGYYKTRWDGKDGAGDYAASGIYLIVLKNDQNILTRKMLMLK
ncbi:MAG: C25 family cysteine peptidase [Candidatus Zhuqueibacterota bacterium]